MQLHNFVECIFTSANAVAFSFTQFLFINNQQTKRFNQQKLLNGKKTSHDAYHYIVYHNVSSNMDNIQAWRIVKSSSRMNKFIIYFFSNLIFCTRYSNMQILTCCGALCPSGTANTSLSRGISSDGHSVRMKELVIPASPFFTSPQKRKNVNTSWSNINTDPITTAFSIIAQKEVVKNC